MAASASGIEGRSDPGAVNATSVLHEDDAYQPLMTVEQSLFAIQVIKYLNHALHPVSFLCTVTNIVVFSQRSMRDSSVYILAVSLSQVLYIAIAFYIGLLPATFTMPTYGSVFFFFYLGIYTVALLRTGSYLVMCLLAGERLYAVLQPLRIKEFVLARHPVPFAAVAFLSAALAHLHLVIKYRIGEVNVPGAGTRYTLFLTSVFRQHRDILTGMSTATKVMFSYLPLLVLIALNVSTVVVMRRYNLKRRLIKTTTHDAERREHQMTVTVVSVTVCYVILSLPLAIFSTLVSLVPEFNLQGRESSVYLVAEDAGFLCILLSCATDFVCFVSLSSAYRATCVRVFRLSRACAGCVAPPAVGTDATD